MKKMDGGFLENRINSDIDKIIIHHTASKEENGIRLNLLSIMNKQFGVPWDILITKNGKYDLSPRWVYALSEEQYIPDVSLRSIIRYNFHHFGGINNGGISLNKNGVNIGVIGNFDIDVPNSFQFSALKDLIDFLKKELSITNVYYCKDLIPTTSPGRFFFNKESLGIFYRRVSTVVPSFKWLKPAKIYTVQLGKEIVE